VNFRATVQEPAFAAVTQPAQKNKTPNATALQNRQTKVRQLAKKVNHENKKVEGIHFFIQHTSSFVFL